MSRRLRIAIALALMALTCAIVAWSISGETERRQIETMGKDRP